MRTLKGFTLIELMVTLAIAAIVLTVGVPGFMATIQNNRITTSLNDFVSDLNLARSEAIKRGSRVTLCKSDDGETCTQDGDWSQGWILFSDPNDNANFDEGAESETLLRVHQALRDDDASLTGNSNLRDYISYMGTGFAQRTTGGVQNGTLVLCDSRGFGEHARAIVLNRTGRPTSMPATESNANNCNVSG